MDEVNALKTRLDKWDFPENKGTMGKFMFIFDGNRRKEIFGALNFL